PHSRIPRKRLPHSRIPRKRLPHSRIPRKPLPHQTRTAASRASPSSPPHPELQKVVDFPGIFFEHTFEYGRMGACR
ncbi:MAG TPA: hypothetical protein PLY47_05010, partial [Rhodoglobus sp.]|nr:hypothetical protein [Rhodoglobus sp.]